MLNSLLRISNIDVYVTGSNSKFLSSDIVTEFRGRGDEIRNYPLSFAEFYAAFDGDYDDAWEEYMVYGGLPQVAGFHMERQKAEYLKNIFTNVYIKDVVERNRIQNVDEIGSIKMQGDVGNEKQSEKNEINHYTIFRGGICIYTYSMRKKDSLEGAWKRTDYQIDQDEQEIEYTESEISFADGRMEKENKTLLYELADDEHSVYLSDGSTETKMEFTIEDNSLFFDGDLYYKADSEEYKQYYAEMEKQAQTELDALIAQVEEEEALKKAKEEALITASQLWDDSVNEMISDFDSAVSDTQERLKKEVISMLEGIWIYNHQVRTDTYIFANGTVTLNQDWGFTKKTAEGIVEVVLTPHLEFSQFDDKQLLNDTLEADSKLDILQKNCPFNEEWELEDLQNAKSYITEHLEPLYSQIDDIKNLTLENLKDSKNILSAIFEDNGLKFGTVDVSTITLERMIMIVNSHEYELYRQ